MKSADRKSTADLSLKSHLVDFKSGFSLWLSLWEDGDFKQLKFKTIMILCDVETSLKMAYFAL